MVVNGDAPGPCRKRTRGFACYCDVFRRAGSNAVNYIYIYVQYILFIPFHCVPLCCMVVHDLHTSDISIYIILYLYLNLYLFYIHLSFYIYIYISVLHVCRCLVTWMEIPIGRPLWVIELEQQLYHQIETKRNSSINGGKDLIVISPVFLLAINPVFHRDLTIPHSWHATQL